MLVLVAGLVLFLGIHLVPASPPLRAAFVARIGEVAYKTVFSVVSAVGLVLIVLGFAWAPRQVPLFTPAPLAVAIAPAAMVVSLTLFAAANLKGHLRRLVGHPMLVGTIVWSSVHLAANGDVASTWLFGAFLAWALADLASSIARRTAKAFEPRLAHDLIAIVAGAGAALAFAFLHRVLFGVRIVPFGL